MRERPLHLVSVQTTNERGGGEYANVNLLDALANRDWNVSLLTNMPDLADGTQVPVRAVDLGPKLSRRTIRPVLRGFPRNLSRLRRELRQEAARTPVDVTLLHYKKEQLMGLGLGREAGMLAWAEWGPLPEPFRSGPLRVAYATAARRAREILAVSDGTRDSLVDAGIPAQKITVVPPLVDTTRLCFRPEARTRLRAEWEVADGAFVVGCVSRLHGSKRNDVVIDALAYLPEHVVLVFAGSGDHEQALRARAARFGGRVRFLPTPRGWVDEMLSACDVQVFAPQPVEGAPRSIMFGQLTERPVVAAGAMGAAGVVEPGTGTIVSPELDPRALAASLDEYRRDPERCAREGAAGRLLALERYDTGRTTDAIERVLSAAAAA